MTTMPFQNDDQKLRRETERVLQERRDLRLEGLVGGLEAVFYQRITARSTGPCAGFHFGDFSLCR